MSEMIPRLEKEEAKWETSLQEEEQRDEEESRVKLDKSTGDHASTPDSRREERKAVHRRGSSLDSV